MDLGVGSHVPILAAAVARTARGRGPVLECGMGWWSTPLLHLACRGRYLRSVESNAEWLEKFRGYASPTHQLMRSDFDDAVLSDVCWSLAFVDHSPGESRVGTIRKLKGKADFIIAHDTEADIPPSGGNYGWKQLEGIFKYEVIYKDVRPWTTIYSDIEAFEL